MYYKYPWAFIHFNCKPCYFFGANIFIWFELRHKLAHQKSQSVWIEIYVLDLVRNLCEFAIYLHLFMVHFLHSFTPFRPAAWRRSDRRNKASFPQKDQQKVRYKQVVICEGQYICILFCICLNAINLFLTTIELCTFFLFDLFPTNYFFSSRLTFKLVFFGCLRCFQHICSGLRLCETMPKKRRAKRMGLR